MTGKVHSFITPRKCLKLEVGGTIKLDLGLKFLEVEPFIFLAISLTFSATADTDCSF